MMMKMIKCKCSNTNLQDDTNQASTNGSHDNEQNQVANTSSQPNDQPSASNQVPILQPTNITRNHPLDTIIGDISRGVQTRSRLTSFCEHFSFVSSIEPNKIDEALKDVDWVNAMGWISISGYPKQRINEHHVGSSDEGRNYGLV